MRVSASERDHLVRVERPVSDDSFDGAGSGAWELLDEIWVGIKDVPPSRAERLADGISISKRPARVRLEYRDDIDASMRFVLGSRVMQIVAGPAEIGRRGGIEFMVEDYSVAGNGA